MTRVLVVDDEPNLRHTLAYALRQEGYDVVAAEDGTRGLELFRSSRPDVVVLDLMLPGIDGLEVCRRIRREADTPILMLTARDAELDKVVGLEVGADDYLTKPFSTRELIARLRALLRRATRTSAPEAAEVSEIRGLRIDAASRRVSLAGRELDLTAREFDLLRTLAREPGRVHTRDQLLERVWGLDRGVDARTVDTHVKTLRERLGDDARTPRWIETVRGVGYRFLDR